MTAETRRSAVGLGRGLAALIPQRDNGRRSVELPIAAIRHNRYQPRQSLEREQLEELARSIAEHGVLQPVLVSQSEQGYVLIAGERRLRAAQLAGLDTIPAVVRSATDREQLALALVENLQRSDLNALEEAYAFRQLMTEFGLTQEQVAERVGRSRPAVANTLRLLDVAAETQAALRDGTISEGHARALAGLADHARQRHVLAVVTARGLSVRQTEALVRRMRSGRPTAAARRSNRTAEVDRLEHDLREALGTKVSVAPGRLGGRITIEYYDEQDLARIYERLAGGRA
ncbi:MAG: ParB/RepB/Spo0J family partition protein [Chloroflexota bacterium]|nr:ParB/RepB/Spo0J family partition protein [Chloroflexota bacterium]